MKTKRNMRELEALLVARTRRHAELEALLDSDAPRTRTHLVKFHKLTEQVRKIRWQLAEARTAAARAAETAAP